VPDESPSSPAGSILAVGRGGGGRSYGAREAGSRHGGQPKTLPAFSFLALTPFADDDPSSPFFPGQLARSLRGHLGHPFPARGGGGPGPEGKVPVAVRAASLKLRDATRLAELRGRFINVSLLLPHAAAGRGGLGRLRRAGCAFLAEEGGRPRGLQPRLPAAS
jgi:hypothetical protein